MVDKLIIGILGVILGIIISKISTHLEVGSLKNQLFESEQNNEEIIKDNADLVRQNDELRKKIYIINKRLSKYEPDFKEW